MTKDTVIAQHTAIDREAVNNTIKLLESGATIPFISRYRQEVTKGLDEVEVHRIRDEWNRIKELENRKQTILRSIEEQGSLTEELKQQITHCYNPRELEDLYLPYRPRKKSKATNARANGLEPLAQLLFNQQNPHFTEKAKAFVNEAIADPEEALQGARDIIAEWVSEDLKTRKQLRQLFEQEARIVSKKAKGQNEDETSLYKDYFNSEEWAAKCPSHRILAMFRGEREGALSITVIPSKEKAIQLLQQRFIKKSSACREQLGLAINDAYTRLIRSSLQKEMKNKLKEKADDEAIKVFAVNLRQLLMAPPLGAKNVLALDPGYKSGCKVVCLDKQGSLRHNETIYPHPPYKNKKAAQKKIASLISMFDIEAIAIGNGTAGRETEHLIKSVKFDRDIAVFVVDESGASVYSASETAREEFPNYDVTVRGAVSIGRRLMDPLAELVKIDPKSIGVGQYQHDVQQQKLIDSLHTVVESCVNRVGVNLNTASQHLLTYISGLGPALAANIRSYREKYGAFTSREALKSVPRLGDKAFEQAAGFLRIPEASNPLDDSAVHPESYHIVEQMAKDVKATIHDLINNKDLRAEIDLRQYITETIGYPTLKDIMNELEQPGRDPREKAAVCEFDHRIKKPEDVQPGMVVQGMVTNITNFGAFVDIGVKQDGLVHISELADAFVKNPADFVSLHQPVQVKVLEVDLARKRIGLSIKQARKSS